MTYLLSLEKEEDKIQSTVFFFLWNKNLFRTHKTSEEEDKNEVLCPFEVYKTFEKQTNNVDELISFLNL